MKSANLVWIVLQVLIGYNLVLPLFLYILYKITRRKIVYGPTMKSEIDYAIIVTAYQQTDLLHDAINSLLQLEYSNYLIYVVADNCDIKELIFNDEKVIVLCPETILASNKRSHFYAIQRFKRNHEVLTIIDSDNIVDPSYLNELNFYFNKGYRAVQGIRAAKNLNTDYACLDAARDIYYHFYDGEVLFQLGSSATLSGSGMAFKTQLYKDCLEQLNITGAGFDKVLQYEIVKRKERIAFAKKAVVYDEKTTMSEQLVKQRARWINTWFKYFSFGFNLIRDGFLMLNCNQFLFGLILLRPPLFIFLILSFVCLIIDAILFQVAVPILCISILCFILSFYFALISGKTDRKIYKSIVKAPKFIFYQLMSLSKVKRANKYSVATTHTLNMKVHSKKNCF